MPPGRRGWWRVIGLEQFTIYNIVAMSAGGILAAVLMQPWVQAGPVRVTTYIVFFVAAVMLARRYLAIVRDSEDGLASVFLIAACLWWMSFAITAIAIEYLIVARVYGFWPHVSVYMQERVAYFFIGGSAIGALSKAITFQFIPKQMLMGHRVQAWPLTVGRRYQEQSSNQIDEREHDVRDREQDVREREQDAREHDLDGREERSKSSE